MSTRNLGRDYKAPQFGSLEQGQFQQRQVSGADTRAQTPMVIGDTSWKDKLLSDWGSKASSTLMSLSEQSLVNDYLEGQAKAGIIQSEAELEGNVLTRDWKVAGYRDTMGKLAMAESQAKFKEDIVDLREKDGTVLQDYLAKRRAALTPMLGSMSRDARAQVAGQLLLQDNADIATWKTQNAAFIIDTKRTGYATALGMQFQTLRDTQTAILQQQATQENYNNALRNTMGVLEMGVWNDSGLTHKLKQDITTDALLQGLHADQPQAYEYIRDNQIPNADGTASSMLSRLSSDDQTKLSDEYRKSMLRTEGIRNVQARAAINDIEAQVNADVIQDVKGLQSTVTAALFNGTIDSSKADALMTRNLTNMYKLEQAGLKVAEKNARLTNMAKAVQIGDPHSLSVMGATEQEGIDAYIQIMNKAGVPAEGQLVNMLTSAPSTLMYKQAGSMLASSITELRLSDAPLTQHSKVMQTFMDFMLKHKDSGQTGLVAGVLQGIPEADRAFATSLFKAVRNGEPTVGAVATARAAYLRENNSTAGDKAVALATNSDIRKRVLAEVKERSAFSWMGLGKVYDLAKNTIQGKEWGGINTLFNSKGDPTAELRQQAYAEELSATASELMQAHPFKDADEIMDLAQADISSRTVPTRFNDIVLPKGASVTTVFKVDNTDAPLLGDAIGKVIKTTAQNTGIHIRISEGVPVYDEYSLDSGVPQSLMSKVVPLEAIKHAIADTRIQQQTQATYAFSAKNVVYNLTHPRERTGNKPSQQYAPSGTPVQGVVDTTVQEPANTPKRAKSSIKDLAAQGEGDFDSFGTRADGTPKGRGFLGVLKRPDGGVATEYSIGVGINGKEVEIPTLVPTLTRTEVMQVLSLPDGAPPSKAIRMKAEAFAEYRMSKGLPVFAKDGEQGDILYHEPATMHYNGDNSAGVPASTALAFRNNLRDNEGVRDKEYKDLSGAVHKDGPRKGKPIMTVGIGVSSHNKWYPKTDENGYITGEQMRESFMGASNDALVHGADLARSKGMNTSSAIQLFSELAYQSGTAFNTQANATGTAYRVFLKAMDTGDVLFAKHAFKNTPAWKWSGGPDGKRGKKYMQLIEQSMNGG